MLTHSRAHTDTAGQFHEHTAYVSYVCTYINFNYMFVYICMYVRMHVFIHYDEMSIILAFQLHGICRGRIGVTDDTGVAHPFGIDCG